LRRQDRALTVTTPPSDIRALRPGFPCYWEGGFNAFSRINTGFFDQNRGLGAPFSDFSLYFSLYWVI
jgi:hypothetical protein